MRKILSVVMVLLSTLVLFACVTVANKAPVLTGPGFVDGVKNVTIKQGDAFDPLEGVKAIDDRDGDITGNIIVSGWDEETNTSLGTHEIVISIKDKEGLEAKLTINLVVESDDPTLKPPLLEGVVTSQTYYIGSGSWNPLEGVVAWDSEDKTEDITDLIVVRDIEGVHYNLDTPGTYNVRIRVTNASGIQANVTIKLTVLQPDIPVEITKDEVSIEMWHAMGGDITTWMRQTAIAFENEYKALGYNFKVTIANGTGNYDTLRSNVSNAIIEKNLPNIIQGYPDHVAEYLNGNAIINLDPYIFSGQYGLNGDDDLEDILESYREENKQYLNGDSYYSLPFNKSSEVLIYNKPALAHALGKPVNQLTEEDVPQTWQDWFLLADDLIAYGKTKNTEEPNLVKAGSYDSLGNGFITLTRQFNGKYTSIDPASFRGQYLWHTDANTFAAMQFVKDNRDVFVVPDFWGQDYSTTPFAEQKVAFAISSSAGVRHNQNAIDALPEEDKFDIGVTTVPYNKNMPNYKAVIQQGTNLSLANSGTRDQKLVSWLFLKYLIRTENTVDFAIETGYFPVRESGFTDPRYLQFLDLSLPGMTSIQKANALSAKAASLQRAYFFYDPAFVGSSRARTEVGLALQTIVTGDGDIQKALNKAYSESNLGN